MTLEDRQRQPELDGLVIPESRVLTPQDFLGILALRTEIWLEEDKDAAVVAEFTDEPGSEWSHVASQHGISAFPVGVDVVRAALLRDEGFDYAVALTDRIPFHAAGRIPTFEFGLQRHRGETLEPTINRIATLVNQGAPWSHGSGRFYVDPVLRRVRVDCWADAKEAGGDQLNRLPQERLRSGYGLAASLAMLQRVVQSAA